MRWARHYPASTSTLSGGFVKGARTVRVPERRIDFTTRSQDRSWRISLVFRRIGPYNSAWWVHSEMDASPQALTHRHRYHTSRFVRSTNT
jgi:hypothetical protein